MQKTAYLSILIGIIVASFLSSCKVLTPSMMMKTNANYPYAQVPVKGDTLYTIGINDELGLELYANDGIKMIDILNAGNINDNGGEKLTYWVDYDGTVRFPVIGRIHIAGKTIRQAEDTIEKLFAKVYNNPFARLNVENRRAIVYPGNGGMAKVISLKQPNVTLMEAIAEAGGIALTGKAYKIKLVRGDYDNPQVFLLNLRKMDGLKDADIILQPNDIIYVEEQKGSQSVFREVIPWLSSATSLLGLGLTIYTLTKIK